MKKEQLKGILIALLFLGGCNALQLGPKYIWSNSVMKEAENMNWVCVGVMHVGEITNPVTWFWGTPTRHFFVKKDHAWLLPGSSSVWLVQKKMIDFDEDQTTDNYDKLNYIYDADRNKTAFIAGDHTSKQDIKKNMQNLEWEDPKTNWDKNILYWLKDGKSKNLEFCN